MTALAKRKGKVSKNDGLTSDTTEESVTYVAKKGKKISRDDRSLLSKDTDSESSGDKGNDDSRLGEDGSNAAPVGQQSPSGSEYSPSGDKDVVDEEDDTQYDRRSGSRESLVTQGPYLLGFKR